MKATGSPPATRLGAIRASIPHCQLRSEIIRQKISKEYEPNSVEVSRLTIEAPPGTGLETDETSGFAHTTFLGRERWGTIGLREERASGTQRTTRFDYANGDPDLIFPSTITNSLGQKTTFWPHATLGVARASDDPNGVRTTWHYDALGRLRLAHRSGSPPEYITY